MNAREWDPTGRRAQVLAELEHLLDEVLAAPLIVVAGKHLVRGSMGYAVQAGNVLMVLAEERARLADAGGEVDVNPQARPSVCRDDGAP